MTGAPGFVEQCALINVPNGRGIDVRPVPPSRQQQNFVERHIQSIKQATVAVMNDQDILPRWLWLLCKLKVYNSTNRSSNESCPLSTPAYEFTCTATEIHAQF